MVSAERYLATHVLGVFRLSFMGMGPTELRILLAIGTLFLLYKPIVKLGGLGSFHLFDLGGICRAVYRSFCNFPLGGNFSGYRVFG